jgi:hypothetical protein
MQDILTADEFLPYTLSTLSFLIKETPEFVQEYDLQNIILPLVSPSKKRDCASFVRSFG